MLRVIVTMMLAGIAADAAAGQPKDLMAGNIAVRADILAAGLDHPWGLDFLPDGSLIVTERTGALRILQKDRLSEPVAGVPDVAAKGQGGLLDVALSPNFAASRLIFLSFSEPGPGGASTALARARLAGGNGKWRLDDLSVIFRASKKTGSGVHFGSRIVFSPDGALFLTLGERGERDRAQDGFDHAGSVIRIHPDGSVPPDNPFADGAKALPEIWSKGHRNPQGAAWDTLTGGLLTVEHGARGGDEVNSPQPGRNYGWPIITFGRDYTGLTIGEGTQKAGYEQPLHYWDPSIAPSGLAVYSGSMFPEWQGDLLVGALKFELLSRLDRDSAGKILAEERYFEGEFGRIRDVNVGPDGAIYLLTDDDDGAIIRLTRG